MDSRTEDVASKGNSVPGSDTIKGLGKLDAKGRGVTRSAIFRMHLLCMHLSEYYNILRIDRKL